MTGPPAGSGPRCALVTGASSGIGEATARLLAREGYRVALLARRTQELERVAAALESPARGHLVLPADLSDPDSIRSACAELGRAFGRLDLLVNNAGVGYRARVDELDPEHVARVLATNVTGLLFVCRHSLPLLQSSSRPVVVNVASVVGRRGIPGQSVYAASKAAVCSIGEALRIEWAEHRIAVCTLNPALTATGFFEAQQNPSDLAHPDLSRAAGSLDVAREILALDKRPRAERNLRWKWRVLGAASALFPRLSDHLLVRGLGAGWRAPRR